jgi:hypothetical protein
MPKSKALVILPIFFAIILLFILLGRNRNTETIKYLGTWQGKFSVEKIDKGSNTPAEQKAYSLSGYVKISLSKREYKMFLEGPQQHLTIAGNWTFSEKTITLKPSKIDIVTDGGLENFNPNKPYIPDEKLNIGYGKPLTFRLSKDQKTLQGLTTTIANLVGTHVFVKE